MHIMPSLSDEDLKTIVSRSIGPNVKILAHQLKDFSDTKYGVVGIHQCLTVDAIDESNATKITRTYFVKEAIKDSNVAVLDHSFHVEEVHFFSKVHPLLLDNYVGEKWSLECYLVKEDVLVLEDLRVKGYAVSEDTTLDDESLKSGLKCVARFHGASVAVETRLGKTLKELYPGAFFEKVFANDSKFGTANRIGFDTIALMAKRFGLDSSLVPKIRDHVLELVKDLNGVINVLGHADLWKNNLMFNTNDPRKCILVDYQVIRYTSPVLDIAMYLYLHTTPNFRKKMDGKILETSYIPVYYSAFKDALLRNSVSEEKIPSFTNILKEYRDRRIVGMAYACLYLPGILLKPERFHKLMNDSEELKGWFFGNRFRTISLNMKEDPTYEKQMKDLVTEILDEGRRVIDKQIVKM